VVEAGTPSGVGVRLREREDDSRAVLLAATGDVAAFEQLVQRHQRYVETLLARACGDATLAEDLTQLTFLTAWRRLHSLRDVTAFRAWLRRVALNLVVDVARRGSIKTVVLSEETAARGTGSAEETIVQRMDVDAALARLSFGQRVCIVLAFGEKMSHSEIAAALDMPIGTVKSHIARGVAALRTLLRAEEGCYDRS
jgi:RNA polymerase sigma factor (sigma-70 family)